MEKVRETCNVYPFYESDLDGQLTAFATEPLDCGAKEHFKKYQLLQ